MASGITHLAYRLPSDVQDTKQLQAAGRLRSPANVMHEFGFSASHEASSADDLTTLMIQAGKEVLERSGVGAADIEWLFVCSGQSDAVPDDAGDELHRFRFPLMRAQHELGLAGSQSLSLGERGCSGVLSAVRLASQLLHASERDHVLCLAGDMLGSGSRREILYNVMSDAAGAFLVSKKAVRNRIVNFHDSIQPSYWDTPRLENEILAAYFPMAQRSITSCIEKSGLSVQDIRWVVPHNVSLRSWQILAALVGIHEGRVWTRNIARIGHTVSCDHIINLADMQREQAIAPGDHVLLFTFGFGASWSCLLLQH